MKRSTLLLVRITPVLALTLAISSPSESAEWDQEAVTKVAEQLPQATEKLYTTLYSEGAPPVALGAMGGDDAYHEFKDRVRLMHAESLHLASALKEGKGRAETIHAFQRIKELNDDAKEYATQQYSENPVTSGFSTVEGLLDQLVSFYRR